MELEVVLRGILTVLSQGCKWRAIDQPGAGWNAIYKYYWRWSHEGLWGMLWAWCAPKLVGTKRFVDSTHVKAHRCASNARGGREHQALGRTKGGLNTRIHAVVDLRGRPANLFLSAGNEADISHAEALLEEVPAAMLVADKGYDSDSFRDWLRERGTRPCIPPRSNRKAPESYSKSACKKRHLVENFFERIKNYRRVATRYDKLAVTYLGFVYLATTVLILR